MDDRTLTHAVAALLAAAGVGVWRPAGPAYTADETGIHYGAIPAAPDRGVGVRVYLPSDDIETGLATRWVQLRTRGARNSPDGADVIADANFRALHDTYPGGGIARIVRTTSAPLGADDNGRQERTDTYQLILDNPEATP